MAIAFNIPIAVGEMFFMRAMGKPSRIVSPAIAPSTIVQPNESGPRVVPPKLGSIARIARFIAPARFGVPS